MIHIFTIVLDGMPFIQAHYDIFKQLSVPWEWHISEGACGNTHCTSWCQPQEQRNSQDGTFEYLVALEMKDPRVHLTTSTAWPNKLAMVNHAIKDIKEPCALLEVDADEIHSVLNIERIHNLLITSPWLGGIQMPCRYFVGPDLLCVGENCWSNRATEWYRAFAFEPGMEFVRHEPPVWPTKKIVMTRGQARAFGLTFDHYAYATREQVVYKEKFYGYKGLVEQWEALQAQTTFPVRLDAFFPFATPSPKVIRIKT
jgi:hypothetical protein